jgi:hypothetical protein
MYLAKIVMKVLVLKLKIKCVNSRISGSQSFCGPFMIPVTTFIYCDVCRKAGQDITGKTKFVELINIPINLYYTTPICIYSWINALNETKDT